MEKTSPVLLVTYVSTDSLCPNPSNARTHTKRQVRQIASSIESFGFNNPILVNSSNVVVAGHGRLAAAKFLGLAQVPIIRIEGLTDDQIRAYIIADNRLAERAGWDRAILAIELQHLLTIDENFDVTVTGFEIPEVDLILEEAKVAPEKDESLEVEIEGPAISQTGDLWILGKHRILSGNSLEASSYKVLLEGRKANVVFADPPYNVTIEGNVSGKGAVHHRDFAMASGGLSEAQFTAFLATCIDLMVRNSASGSIHFVCMDWRHISQILSVGKSAYDEFLNLCVWVKNNGGLGSFYRSQHELIFVFRAGQTRHRNNIQLGIFGRYRTNVWKYDNANTFSRTGDEGNLLRAHPTVKPLGMVADALLDVSARGDLVLDPFLGSGTTLIAAERVGRVCHGIEIDPIYVDVAIRRWQAHTGEHALHAATGKSFEERSRLQEAQHD